MNNHRAYAVWQAHAAQRGESAGVGAFKADLAATEGKTGRDIQSGLEVVTNEPKPRPMESVDPEWGSFVEAQEIEQDSESGAWEIVVEQGQELTLRQAVDAMKEADSDDDLVASALHVVTAAPDRYGQYLGELVEWYDEDYAKEIHAAVSHTLAEEAKNIGALDFVEEMRESEAANTRDAHRALQELADRRGMTQQDMNKMLQAYREGTGQHLPSNLLAVFPHDRDAFLGEVAVQAEVDDRSERERLFKASFFTGGTDIESGLVTKGGVPRDLPPSVTDPGYARFLTEQRVRAEDAERASRPSRQSESDIKRSLVAPASTDIDAGLTDSQGRPTTYAEIARRDPDSVVNQNERQRQRDAFKLASLTGGRVIR